MPKLNTSMLKAKLGKIKDIFLKISENIDLNALLKGLIAVVFIYIVLFVFVFFNSSSTIKALEDQLTVENVPVTRVEKSNPHTEDSPLMDIVKGLHENSRFGPLPIIRKKDGLTSFRAYQNPFSFQDIKDKPVISFVIVGYGLSKKQSLSALDLLPPQVSFILSPYASLPGEWMAMAQSKGHEVWLSLPIQNKQSHDQGGNAVYHHSSSIEKLQNMYKSLAKAQGYVGVASYTDKSLNSAKKHYVELAGNLYARGLGFFELNPKALPFIEGKALTMGAPYIKADLNIFRIKGNKNSFETLEAIAQKNGHVIAIIPSSPATIKNLAVWIMKVAQADYIIAPVSAIYDLPLHRSNASTSHNQTRNTSITPSNLHINDHIEPEEPPHQPRHIPESHHH